MIKLKSLLRENIIPIYRGVSSYNKKGNSYWTIDKQWARQFTQSGLESEVRRATIDTRIIYRANPLTRATSDSDFDRDIPIATANGFKALWVNEGNNEPNSIYVIDKTALI